MYAVGATCSNTTDLAVANRSRVSGTHNVSTVNFHEGVFLQEMKKGKRLLASAAAIINFTENETWDSGVDRRFAAAASAITRRQSNLTKSASRGAHSPVRGSKVVPLNSWGRVSY